MKIKRLKNIIGLCACEGCPNHFEILVKVEFKNKKDKPVYTPFKLRKFRLCEDCAAELIDELAQRMKVIEE